MKRIKYFLAICAVIIMTLVQSCTSGKTNDENTNETAKETNDENIENKDQENDADFIVDVVAANYGEIHLAQQALKTSQDVEIKNLASMIEADHTKSLDELKSYASNNGIVIPMEETDAAKKDQQKLSEKDAEDFDKKWCSELIDVHEKTINKFQKRLDKTEDPELKNWINNTLPALNRHLQMLKDHEARTKDAK